MYPYQLLGTPAMDQSAQPPNQNLKNTKPKDTKKIFAEALGGETNAQNIQNQLNQLVQTVKWLVENAKTGGSLEYRTKKTGNAQRRGNARFKEGKKQF